LVPKFIAILPKRLMKAPTIHSPMNKIVLHHEGETTCSRKTISSTVYQMLVLKLCTQCKTRVERKTAFLLYAKSQDNNTPVSPPNTKIKPSNQNPHLQQYY